MPTFAHLVIHPEFALWRFVFSWVLLWRWVVIAKTYRLRRTVGAFVAGVVGYQAGVHLVVHLRTS